MNKKNIFALVITGLLIASSGYAISQGVFGDKPVTSIASETSDQHGDVDYITPSEEQDGQTASQSSHRDSSVDITAPDSIAPSTGSESPKTVNISTAAAAPKTISQTPTPSNSISRGTDYSKYPLASKINGSYGQFHYRNLSGGRIEVDPQWINANIVTITLPGLNRKVQVHREAADNFIKAFTYIKNGTAVVNGKQVSLLSLVKTMDGTWVTRHVNWDPSRELSNHSWGTAIDINAGNHFRYVDPTRELNDPNLILWEKAFKPAGFSWGNRYADSMHFELLD